MSHNRKLRSLSVSTSSLSMGVLAIRCCWANPKRESWKRGGRSFSGAKGTEGRREGQGDKESDGTRKGRMCHPHPSTPHRECRCCVLQTWTHKDKQINNTRCTKETNTNYKRISVSKYIHKNAQEELWGQMY